MEEKFFAIGRCQRNKLNRFMKIVSCPNGFLSASSSRNVRSWPSSQIGLLSQPRLMSVCPPIAAAMAHVSRCLKRADSVEKVENTANAKFSQKLIRF
jgi:hypothetical protein